MQNHQRRKINYIVVRYHLSNIAFNKLRPRQSGRHFLDFFKSILVNENVWISIEISLNFVSNYPLNNIPVLVQVWLGADQATSHCLNQWWSTLLTHKRVNPPQCAQLPKTIAQYECDERHEAVNLEEFVCGILINGDHQWCYEHTIREMTTSL